MDIQNTLDAHDGVANFVERYVPRRALKEDEGSRLDEGKGAGEDDDGDDEGNEGVGVEAPGVGREPDEEALRAGQPIALKEAQDAPKR